MSGMEAGVFALSRLRIRQHMRAGRRSAQVLHRYLENPENFLWTIFVGNTIANLIVLGWLTAYLHQFLQHHRLWFVVLFSMAVFLFYIFSDLLPKMLFRQHPNRLCMAMVRPFRAFHFVLRPLVALVEWCSGLLLRWRGGKTFKGHLFGNREELRLVMQESARDFTSDERNMINRVLDLQSLTVRQAMKPLNRAAMIGAHEPVSQAMAICRDQKLTRLPAYETRNGQQRIVGLVSMNTVLYDPAMTPAHKVSDYLRPALYLDENLRLEVALRRMQRSGQRLGVVLGRDQREVGLLSLQDVLRIIFGEVSL
jgi:putative hemolysin